MKVVFLSIIGYSYHNERNGGFNMTVKIGEKAPDFKLPANNGEMVSLSDFKGKNIVLYFYPKDMTPGCTTEACDFRDHNEQFEELNAVILGISPDPAARHENKVRSKRASFRSLAFPWLPDML